MRVACSTKARARVELLSRVHGADGRARALGHRGVAILAVAGGGRGGFSRAAAQRTGAERRDRWNGGAFRAASLGSGGWTRWLVATAASRMCGVCVCGAPVCCVPCESLRWPCEDGRSSAACGRRCSLGGVRGAHLGSGRVCAWHAGRRDERDASTRTSLALCHV